jgi:hypothetical protein
LLLLMPGKKFAGGVSLTYYAGHNAWVTRLAGDGPLGDARIACRQWMSQRQPGDMVFLLHIQEQHRLYSVNHLVR